MKTDMDRRFAELRGKDGRTLKHHPAYVIAKQLISYNGPYDLYEKTLYATANVRQNEFHRDTRISTPIVNTLAVTMTIEEMNALLRQSNSEVSESVQALNDAWNKISAMKELLIPQLTDMTKQIQQSRMTTEREMKSTLDWLQTVRKFFLEKDYDTEMTKLQSFISLCKDIQALKDAGTLDAVADLAIKLAVGEVEP